MFVGMLILYLPLSALQTVAVAAVTMVAMSFNLYLLGRRVAIAMG